jgi:hypothetical protein
LERFRQHRGIGAVIGNQRLAALGNIQSFKELLRYLHHFGGGEGQLAACGLLEGGGREGSGGLSCRVFVIK